MHNSNILEQNLYDKKFQGQFLVIGSCLPNIYPEIVEKFENKWKNVVHFCLEQMHYNMLMAKLFDILAVGKVNKVGFLTVEGSPHCVQMHYASKYLKRGLKNSVEFEHYVIRKDGKVFKVSIESIDQSKDLSNFGEEFSL
jgi:hypothetical protein